MHTESNARKYWIETLIRIVSPVLINLNDGTLKEKMPVEGKMDDRSKYTYLEALARSLVGLASWLESDVAEEDILRNQYAELARGAIDAGTNPESPDYMNFTCGAQPLVDSAFLAHAILRAPNELWHKLSDATKKNVIKAMKGMHFLKPGFNNWLLFSAMIETFLYFIGEDYDKVRIDYAIRQHEQWYKGDGIYGDGPDFHWDYYNSFVIQPMLIDILKIVGKEANEWEALKEPVFKRASRYSEILERMISPEGTFPPVGRSLAYRFGVFQLLAQSVLNHSLPDTIYPQQVRCALTSVIHRMIEAEGMFDENGWLKIGLCGSQPDIGETYISTGSLYLCSTVFLPLGLPKDDIFWSREDMDWTSKKIWSGENVKADKALEM